MKYITRVARVSSSTSLQHGDSSFAHSSRYSGAIAAFFVVAFVLLAAFAFVHSATACGHSDPAGGSCFQCGVAATLATLLVASFVFVLLFFVAQEPAGVHSFCDMDVLNMFYVIEGFCTLCQRLLVCRWCLHHLPKLRQLHLFDCIMQQPLCVSGYPLLSRG